MRRLMALAAAAAALSTLSGCVMWFSEESVKVDHVEHSKVLLVCLVPVFYSRADRPVEGEVDVAVPSTTTLEPEQK